MPYYHIQDFKLGLEKRKHPVSAPPGSLISIKNAHITAGGEVEKRFAFENIGNVAGTYGLATVGDSAVVFGTAGTPPGGLTLFPGGDSPVLNPGEIYYQPLTLESPATGITDIRSWDIFDGKLYVDVNVDGVGADQHFYDGVFVSDSNANGRYVKVHNGRVYSLRGNRMRYSALNDPTDWTDGDEGAGFVDLSSGGDDVTLYGIAVYFDQLAIFSAKAIQLWQPDSDPLKFQLRQTLQNTGAVGPYSQVQYGNGDVIYLAGSGIRSLRARDSSNLASVSDIGSPIDSVITAQLANLSGSQLADAAALVQPRTGRLWMLLNGKAYVYSGFPGPGISAWSEYELGFTPTHSALMGNQAVIRDDQDNIHLYAGLDGDLYDNSEVRVALPWLDFEKPAHKKTYSGLDVVVEGSWQINMGLDPNTGNYSEVTQNVFETTYDKGRLALSGTGSHIGLEFVHTSAEAARISQLAIHYSSMEAD